MKSIILALVGLGSVYATPSAASCTETLDYRFKALNSAEEVHLCEHYQGKVLLVVNTASFCGYTPQYEGLEQLYRDYRERGLVVLGFPSNDFGNQEPGSEQEIAEFCRLTYSVEFPMFEKTSVARGKAHPFFDQLADATGGYPRWNFHKYLIDREGQVVAAWPSKVKPGDAEILNAIEKRL